MTQTKAGIYKILNRRNGVGTSTISDIKHNKRWKRKMRRDKEQEENVD